MLTAFRPLCGSGAPRGFSSVGRALAWHARGQGFESPKLHTNPVIADYDDKSSLVSISV
jgi:hypothetical protein